MRISILSPDYDFSSGGIRALHYLGFLAHKLGHAVDMNCEYLNPEWGKYSTNIDDHDFMIIPEIITETSPLMGNVVRWCLYFPGRLCGGPKKYPEHEYVVSYHHEYTESIIEATNGKYVPEFFLPYSDMSGADKNKDKIIPGVIWYGKHPIIENHKLANMSVITRQWPATRRMLINLLNATETLYSYDPYTSINEEALLCGCNVLLWDGEKFEKYENDNPEINVMNIDRDMMNVNGFINSIVKHFGI